MYMMRPVVSVSGELAHANSAICRRALATVNTLLYDMSAVLEIVKVVCNMLILVAMERITEPGHKIVPVDARELVENQAQEIINYMLNTRTLLYI